jgi:hypothetical protein
MIAIRRHSDCGQLTCSGGRVWEHERCDDCTATSVFYCFFSSFPMRLFPKPKRHFNQARKPTQATPNALKRRVSGIAPITALMLTTKVRRFLDLKIASRHQRGQRQNVVTEVTASAIAGAVAAPTTVELPSGFDAGSTFVFSISLVKLIDGCKEVPR